MEPDMSRIARTTLLAATLALPAGLAAAGTLEDNMKTFVETEVSAWFADPVIIAAIQGANTANGALTPEDIQNLDSQWQAEIGTEGVLIPTVLDSAASAFLREKVGASGGKISEVIVMDMLGLNVAVSDVTSDFWQGDEDKHQKTYGVGPGAVHISDVELDESTQTYQAQVSITLADPATGIAIGAVTVGVNAEFF
jgi:hypothetical protein